MPFTYTARLRGHPWDLWGLSKIFDGSNADHTRIVATQPVGRPMYDPHTDAGRLRYARLGFDDFALLTTDALTFPEGSQPTFDVAKSVANEIILRINGIGRLIDPEYLTVSLYELSYVCRGGSGSSDAGRMPKNKENTWLGQHPAHQPFGALVFSHAASNTAVRFVLDAIALPATWASLYLVYDAIKDEVGGQAALEKMDWVKKSELSDFRYSANTSRQLKEGARHGGIPDAPKPLITLSNATDIIERLARAWLRSI